MHYFLDLHPLHTDNPIMRNKETFGMKLKTIRLSRNLTFEQIGEMIGVKASTVYRIENGKSRANERTRYQIVRVFPELEKSA